MKRKPYRIIFLILFLFITSIAMAGEAVKGDDVAATVDEFVITHADLTREVDRIIPFTTYHRAMSKERIEKFRKDALETLILNELKYQRAEKLGMKVEKKELKKRVKETKNRFSSNREFKKALKTMNLTFTDFKKIIKKGILVSRITKEKEDKQVTVSDQELLEYYNKNRKKFVIPEQRRLKVILFKVDPGARSAVWEDTKKKAADIRKKILNGISFSEMAKKHSDDKSKTVGGELGFVHRGQLLSEVNDEAFKLKKGEIGEVLESLYGYHLVKVVAIKPNRALSFEEVKKERLRMELKRKKEKDIKTAWLAGLREGVEIKTYINN